MAAPTGGNEFSGYPTEAYGYGGHPAFPGAAPFGFGAPPFGMPPGSGFEPSPLDAEIQVVLREIHAEQQLLEQAGPYGEQLKNARRLLATESQKLENTEDPEWLEVDINKPIKVTKKVIIPSFRHPTFNFVGKVLGPKGTTLQNIAKTFKCHVYILGRGSTRDRSKEQELLATGDAQYAHYGGPLHVKVETVAPPATAYQRVAAVLNVLAQLLQPVKDTHIEGITTEPNPVAKTGEQGGDTERGNGNPNAGNDNEASGSGGGAQASADFKEFKPPGGGGGGPMRASFRGGGRGGFRGGFGAGRGGFGGGRGGPGRGNPWGRGGRGGGFKPY